LFGQEKEKKRTPCRDMTKLPQRRLGYYTNGVAVVRTTTPPRTTRKKQKRSSTPALKRKSHRPQIENDDLFGLLDIARDRNFYCGCECYDCTGALSKEELEDNQQQQQQQHNEHDSSGANDFSTMLMRESLSFSEESSSDYSFVGIDAVETMESIEVTDWEIVSQTKSVVSSSSSSKSMTITPTYLGAALISADIPMISVSPILLQTRSPSPIFRRETEACRRMHLATARPSRRWSSNDDEAEEEYPCIDAFQIAESMKCAGRRRRSLMFGKEGRRR
jgi:hypothetical protein